MTPLPGDRDRFDVNSCREFIFISAKSLAVSASAFHVNDTKAQQSWLASAASDWATRFLGPW